ncbi:hypothetical protein DHL47_03310 [Streptococcus panodentis]|uniref:CAAX prenyl protease 2/Lysostaphin resistance protein A-like domain-containing protein n=2 Tax=Streptococcus panodentis TaxID=1581472 RepID=A0ABS5AV88_9STRE|nr:hypothetical protein [Streptococcus panodentis]
MNSALVAILMALGLVRFQGIGPASVQLRNLLLLFAATLLQGANEEIIFRGWFFPALSRHYGKWFGLVASACLFGLLHILSGYQDAGLVLNIVLFGAFLCLYVWEKGRIWGAIGIHGMNNFLLTGVLVLDTANPAAQTFGLFVFDSPSPALSAGLMGAGRLQSCTEAWSS